MFIRDFEKFAYRRKQHGYSFYYQYWREVLFDYACKIFLTLVILRKSFRRKK